MKYRSLTHIYFKRSIFVSHWCIIPSTTFLHQVAFKIWNKITGPENIGHWPTYTWCGQSLCHTDPLYQLWYSSIKYSSNLLSKITRPRNIGHVDLYLFLGQGLGHTFLSNSLWNIRQNQWTMKYRSHWPTFILRSCVGSYWFIIPNSLQAIRHNHWTMKYRSQWPTFILRSKVGSYWFIPLKYDVHPLNSVQDTRQKSLDHEL